MEMEVTRIAHVLFPSENILVSEISSLVRNSILSADENYGELEAIEWANGYTFPPGLGSRDAERLRELNGDLAAMTRERHAEMLVVGRLCDESIKNTVDPSDPDFSLLRGLVTGIPIVTAQEFKPNGKPPPLRSKYLRVAPAVNKMMYELYDAGLIFILPTEAALLIPGVHFSSTHWAKKKGKKKGRPIGDASSSESGCPLNGEEVKVKVDALWGSIRHPTVESLVRMISRVASRVGWDKVVLWKIDLKGAFSLLFIKPEDVRLLCFELTDGLTMLYHTGMFGHTEMPCGFDIVTRVLRRTINRNIDANSECEGYVDDIMGASSIECVHSDMAAAEGVCNSLMGPGAVEKTKSSWGRTQDWIGWSMCTDSRTVSIAEHNFLKTMHGFFMVDETKPVRIKVLQKLASWGSRYAAVCRFMRPYTNDLFTAMGGKVGNSNVARRLDTAAQYCIRLWRCCLCLMGLRSACKYTRLMHSYVPSAPKYLVEFDGSLTGVGIIIFRVDENGNEQLWKVARFVFPFNLGCDSSFQNTCELIGLVMAVGCLVALGVSQSMVGARGDSTTALTWIMSEQFRSGPSRGASVCFMALGVRHDIHFKSRQHIRGVDNTICDALSRDRTPEMLGYRRDEIMEVSDHMWLARLLVACNPVPVSNGVKSTEGYENAWREAFIIAEGLKQ
jgi:hypothetical protein